MKSVSDRVIQSLGSPSGCHSGKYPAIYPAPARKRLRGTKEAPQPGPDLAASALFSAPAARSSWHGSAIAPLPHCPSATGEHVIGILLADDTHQPMLIEGKPVTALIKVTTTR